MTPKRRQNLQRLLKPRHVALIGGHDAAIAVGECNRIGYEGSIWPVNPTRSEMGGHKCFKSIAELPEAPDAVFLAIPREAAIEAVAELAELGAGGVVCYTAGFAETGGEGKAAEGRLIEAAGDLAFVGPNCYGLLNYLDRVALWPFARGGATPGYGAAIITQSGMLSSDLTMSQRSFPFAYMVSAGNQAVLALEDFVEAFATQEGVRAIGLHIEGLRDLASFEAAALKALENGVPIVTLKTGSSRIGAELTISHTGSLSGTDDLYSALFERLGIIRVSNPAQLLETCKFLCVSGAPPGARIAGFTCSGGGATMLADHGEKVGLDFPKPTAATATKLLECLPVIATVSNPLDYTTPIWGDVKRVPPVFDALLEDRFDAAVLVQDYPLPEIDDGKAYYLNDARSFIASTARAGIPAALCSTLPENLDEETRDMLVHAGVAPMQGLHETLNALTAAAWHSKRKAQVEARGLTPLVRAPSGTGSRVIDEAEGKALLREAGLAVPEGRLACAAEAPDAAQGLGFPVALKMVHADLAHKTEAGAVALSLGSANDVETAVAKMPAAVAAYNSKSRSDNFLIEKMAPPPIAELMFGIRRDQDFGLAMTLASGGTLVELLDDAVTLLLPAPAEDIADALLRLKLAPLLNGFRGRDTVNLDALVGDLARLADYAIANVEKIAEIEINPLFVYENTTLAIDALVRLDAAD